MENNVPPAKRSKLRSIAKAVLLMLPPIRMLYRQVLAANERNRALQQELEALQERLRVISADNATLEKKLLDNADWKAIYALVVQSHRRLLGAEPAALVVETQKPVAYDSPDHLFPWGTMRDNSVNLKFNLKLARLIPLSHLDVLDLGCAGGGFVRSVLEMGCLAVGIEGSDYSKVRSRAEWKTIPSYLFTADITEPFQVKRQREDGSLEPAQFAVITAWEVMEHLPAERLGAVFANIRRHLKPGGLVILSISPNPDVVEGVALHQTVQPEKWWLAEFERAGFVYYPELRAYFEPDWVRGEPNAPGSFHLVLTLQGQRCPYTIPQN
jgi:SAM-dependent methyltransferase